VNRLTAELDAEKKAHREDEEHASERYSTLMEEKLAQSDYVDVLVARWKAGKRENEKLEESNKKLEVENHDIQLEMDDWEDVNRENEELKERNKQLEDEIQLKEPLFQTGLSIRLRFLENNRAYMFGTEEEERRPDPSIVRRGNDAAHAGLGQGDAVIFQGSWFNDSLPKYPLEETFQKLYHDKPSNYQPRSTKMLEATDLEVTIRTLNAIKEVENRPIIQRQTALENYDYIKDKYEKMSVEKFESDVEVERRLGKLREMTKEIVKADRSTRPLVSPRQSSTPYVGKRNPDG
jgi:hypothetical protein